MNKRPVINLPLPGGSRLQFPNPIKLNLSPIRDLGFAGFLEIYRPDAKHGRGDWHIGDLKFRHHGSTMETRKMTKNFGAGGTVTGDFIVRTAHGVPYALAPEYRAAKAHFLPSGEWTDIELPLAPKHTPVPLENTAVQVAPWTVSFRPKAWKATAAPVEFEVEIEGPNGKELLVDYDWIHHDTMGYNPLIKCGVWAWPNRPFLLTVSARLDRPLVGTINEVEAVPIEFEIIRSPKFKGQFDLLYQGKCVQGGWRENSHLPSSFGFKAFRIGDQFFGNATPNFCKTADETQNRIGRIELNQVGEGPTVKGYGYRVIKSWPFKHHMKRPVSPETLAFGTQPK